MTENYSGPGLKYLGVPLVDQLRHIAQLKRAGRLEEALEVARGCFRTMRQAALENPRYVMERYVLEVALLHHRMGDYTGEIATIREWLELGLTPTREDHRVALKKRLAKSQEKLAKQQGVDAAAYTAKWKELVQEEKRIRARVADGPRPAPARLIPNAAELLESEFVAVDFETANRRGGVSACQVALVRVKGGRIIDQHTTFLRPPPGWDHFEFTYLHGISTKHTRGAPGWNQVAGEVQDFVGDRAVYAHNASFDARVWRELDQHYALNTLPERFYCTYRIARRTLPGLENYKLPTVTKQCAPNFQLNHHDAGSDAQACALIVASLQRNGSALEFLN